MYCRLTISSSDKIVLPFQYNHIIQALLYKFINDEEYSNFLHNNGYTHNKRSFKLFSFSNIITKPLKIDRETKKFVFPEEISIYISCVDAEFLKYIFQSFAVSEKELRIHNNLAHISNVFFRQDVQNYKEEMEVRTLSPITTYSTLFSADGKKKTYYYTPYEEQFSENIRKNLIKKYCAFYDKEPEDTSFSIKPLGKIAERIIIYKGFVIKAYSGDFKISGSEELKKMAFASGIGSKNSQGFGFILPKDEEVL
ncbi:CRISPR-associated endoribonuclease Cas6 [Ruminiclostridium herbifermentans]|uniref:CRISPR-associated endoribonuclease n=1 Tax=Ruminiclostridium herbifermentans TaxID=2488810 RepID=A0A4U7J5E7_9FIRM|nr:CRISPR-associated endoribonuclease Cas6 [Ruminiclostridium herbifermentans]QNU65557.1 CRISPR-associated endoribonuclease Cas6 [Ruminiclostridium herbifermentans]